MRTRAVVVSLMILFSAPLVLAATGQQPNWPASIQGDSGFHDLGRAIAAEPGFPKDGTEVQKARYVAGRLPVIAKTYGLTAADPLPWKRPHKSIVTGLTRIKDYFTGGEPENTGALKGFLATGNCGEWTYAFSEILGGAGVVSRVVFGDTSSAPGYSGGHGGTDTTLIVEERTRDNEISRRVFEAYRPAFHSSGGQPTDAAIAEWNDLPLTDADRLPRDDAAGTPSFQAKVGKPVIKDATSESPLPDVPDKFRPGSTASAARQLMAKAQADLNTARGMINEAREAASAAQAKVSEAESACASSDQAVMAVEGAKSALAGAESVVGGAVKSCAEAPWEGVMETARQTVLDAASQVQNLAARAGPFVDEACKIASMAEGMSDTEPYKSSQVMNANAMAQSARVLQDSAREALARAREQANQLIAWNTSRNAARAEGQAARSALASAREVAGSVQAQAAALKSPCDSAAGLLNTAKENVQRAQERKSSALTLLVNVETTCIPSLQEPEKSTILGQVNSLIGEANAIAPPSVEGAMTNVSRAMDRMNSALASLGQVQQRLAALDQALSACDGLAPTDRMTDEAMAAVNAAASSMQEIQSLVARGDECVRTMTAGRGSKDKRKTSALSGGKATGKPARVDKGEMRRPDRTGSKDEALREPATGGDAQAGADLERRYRDRQRARDQQVDDRRTSSGYGPGVYPGEGGYSGHAPPGWADDGRRGSRGTGCGQVPECRGNQDCGSTQFCHPHTLKCVNCPTGQHPYKDGRPGCHAE